MYCIVACDYKVPIVCLFSSGVGTPTSPTVCNGDTAALECDISQSNGVAPIWRVFSTSDTSGSPVASLVRGDNRPPYNYPEIPFGETVARLEVMASSSIDGYHFQCRLPLLPTPVDSPDTGTITLTGTYVRMLFIITVAQYIIIDNGNK